MRITIQNLLFIFKRFKVASLLNIFGLTVAFTGFILIVIQLNYELGFDKCHSKADNIYNLKCRFTNPENPDEVFTSTLFIRNVLDNVVANSPAIEKATLIYPFIGSGLYAPSYMTVEGENGRQGFKEVMVTCYADVTDIFDFKIVEGNLDLSRPESVIIPRSMAKRMFGSASAIGKGIHFDEFIYSKSKEGENRLDLVVTGVYQDFPQNTQLGNYLYTPIEASYQKDPDDMSSNYLFYALLSKGANPKDIESIFAKNGDIFPEGYKTNSQIKIEKLTDIYYSKENNMGYKSGEYSTSILLIVIGLLIITVAAINFTNLSIALSPSRLKNITIRKVLGSTDTELRLALVIESIIISLLSFILALTLVYIIVSRDLMPFIETDISSSNYVSVALLSLIIAFATGLIAGTRPAFYMTSFAPSEALKGKTQSTSSGFKTRSILIGFQFLVTIALVSITVLMYTQFKFMQDYKLGFDTDLVAVVELSKDIVSKNGTEYQEKLKQNSNIVDVAFSAQKLGASDSYIQYTMQLNGEGNHNYHLLPVSWNFLDVMNIRVIEGRKYTEEDAKSNETSLIINKLTQTETKAKIGDSFSYPWNANNAQRVVGVVDNIQFNSLRNEMIKTTFTLNDKNGHATLPVSYIKIAAGSSVKEAVAHIESTIKSIDPSYPVKIEFYDEIYNELYKRENKLNSSISIFSLLAIIIATLGVFGLVMFEGEYRKKEIALRKTLGSTITQVLILFNKSYARIFGVSFILAFPIIYYAINKWLEQFAYKVKLDWWIFLLGGAVIFIVIVVTVSLQSYRTANINPADVLKNE